MFGELHTFGMSYCHEFAALTESAVSRHFCEILCHVDYGDREVCGYIRLHEGWRMGMGIAIGEVTRLKRA